jgi:hypothetical protein
MQVVAPIIRLMGRSGYKFVSMDRLTLMEDGAMTATNKLGNSLLSLTMRLLFLLPIKDSQSGMIAIRRDLLDKMQLRFNGYGLSQEIKIEACRYCTKKEWIEVPVSYSKRLGNSKLKWWKHGTQNMIDLFSKRLRR